jgi:hypothetical protein
VVASPRSLIGVRGERLSYCCRSSPLIWPIEYCESEQPHQALYSKRASHSTPFHLTPLSWCWERNHVVLTSLLAITPLRDSDLLSMLIAYLAMAVAFFVVVFFREDMLCFIDLLKRRSIHEWTSACHPSPLSLMLRSLSWTVGEIRSSLGTVKENGPCDKPIWCRTSKASKWIVTKHK